MEGLCNIPFAASLVAVIAKLVLVSNQSEGKLIPKQVTIGFGNHFQRIGIYKYIRGIGLAIGCKRQSVDGRSLTYYVSGSIASLCLVQPSVALVPCVRMESERRFAFVYIYFPCACPGVSMEYAPIGGLVKFLKMSFSTCRADSTSPTCFQERFLI